MPLVQANGIDLCYEEYGEGEPLLAVMGLGGQLIDWPPEFVEALTNRGFRVITFDNRDIGLSSEFSWTPPTRRTMMSNLVRPRDLEVGYRLTDMAADAAGLLDVLDIDRAHVVGMSMGGMIAQTLAIEHPRRVLSLTSIMSNTGDRRNGGINPKVMLKILRAPQVSRAEAPVHNTEMYSLWAGSSWDRATHLERNRIAVDRSFRPEGVERQTAAIAASPDRTAALGAVTAPTLVVHGLEDKLVVPSGGTATAAAIPHSRLLMFPDMGHDLPRSRDDEICDAIRLNADRANRSDGIGASADPIHPVTAGA